MSATSRTRAEINRENAKKSTGPRTAEGKARSAQNAVKHGMTAAAPILRHEETEAFDRILNNILEDLCPETGREYDLAIEVAHAWWNRARAYRMHNAFLNSRSEQIAAETDGELQGDYALAQLFIDPADLQRTRLVLRYISAAERTYKAAMAEFRQCREDRLEREETLTEVEETPEPADTFETPAGFVSYNDRIVELSHHTRPESGVPSERGSRQFGEREAA